MHIDLNADLGESFGNYKIGNDEEVMKYISSVNIACGFHAGDPLVMERTIKLALKNDVSIGAHPGYPDLEGFGRRSMKLSNDMLYAMILYQVGALKSMTETLGGKLNHVKLHGALYNDLAYNFDQSKIVAEAVFKIDPELVFVGLANSQMIDAAKKTGLKTANEVFADRTYTDLGTLVPRSEKNAIIHDTESCLSRVEQMITRGLIKSVSGKEIKIKADTICVHGDNCKAVEFVKNLNSFLTQNNIHIKSLKNLNL